MKRIKERLKALTAAILNAQGASKDDFDAYTAELKTLRELIATHKALDSYVEDYGDDDDGAEPRQKRTSDTEWH